MLYSASATHAAPRAQQRDWGLSDRLPRSYNIFRIRSSTLLFNVAEYSCTRPVSLYTTGHINASWAAVTDAIIYPTWTLFQSKPCIQQDPKVSRRHNGTVWGLRGKPLIFPEPEQQFNIKMIPNLCTRGGRECTTVCHEAVAHRWPNALMHSRDSIFLPEHSYLNPYWSLILNLQCKT